MYTLDKNLLSVNISLKDRQYINKAIVENSRLIYGISIDWKRFIIFLFISIVNEVI